jgi:hypothetical protein
MLLVMTFRAEFQAPWIGRAGVSILALSRFGRRDTAMMAAQVAARAIPAELIEHIVAQTVLSRLAPFVSHRAAECSDHAICMRPIAIRA